MRNATQSLEQWKSSGKNSKAEQQKCEQIVACINGDVIRRVNKTLEEHSPAALIQGLEAFVCVLRNKGFSNNVDVELFFKNENSLLAKMKRMQMRDADKEVIKAMLPQLQQAKTGIEGSMSQKPDVSEFSVFVNWAIAFCNGANVELEGKDLESIVITATEKSEAARNAHERTQRLVNDLRRFDFDKFFREDREEHAIKLDKVRRITQSDAVNAEKYQQKLHSFDEEFLSDFVEKAHAQKSNPADAVSLAPQRFSLFR